MPAKKWSRDEILDAMREWQHEHGEAPRVLDWQPSLARANGYPELAARFECGNWPTASLVAGQFGSWNNALAALGVTHSGQGIWRSDARHQHTPEGGETRAWTKDEILAAIRAHHDENGQWPTGMEWVTADPHGKRPTTETVQRICGRWTDAVIAAGGEPVKASKTRLSTEYRSQVRKLLLANPNMPTADIAASVGCTQGIVSRHIRTMRLNGELPASVLIARRQPRKRPNPTERIYSDGELLYTLADCAHHLGCTPSIKAFDKWVGYHAAQLYTRRFGSWTQACELASLTPHTRRTGIGQYAYGHPEFAAAYRRIRRIVGHPIRMTEWGAHRMPSEPSQHTARYRWASWSAFVSEMEANQPTHPPG